MASNALIGKSILILTVSAFTYYLFWVAVLPFLLLDENNRIYSLFPPQHYAFLIPACFGIVFIGTLSIFTLYHVRGAIKLKLF